MPIPKSPAAISNQGLLGWIANAANPATIMKTIPKTRWWMCRPPGETFPGHQETSALIIRVLNRMKPNESSMQPRRISPARWSAVSSALPPWIWRLIAPSKPSPTDLVSPPCRFPGGRGRQRERG